MVVLKDPFFWVVAIEIVIVIFILFNQDLTVHIIDRFELSLRIGFATFLLIISGGTYSSIITIEKDGEIIEEYEIGKNIW